MLIDRLLANLDVTLKPFAVCEVSTGWRLRLGGLDWVTVHFVVSGSGRLRAGGRRIVALPEQSLALVPNNRAHVIETGDPIEHEATATRPRLGAEGIEVYAAGPEQPDDLVVACGRLQARYSDGQGLFDQLQDPLVLEFADSPEMARVFERLLAEERDPSATSRLMLSTLMNEALILLFRRLCTEPECPLPWLTALEDPQMAAPLSLMLEHPEDEHTVASLAASASMSRSAFSDAFKERYDQGPMTYLREVRMREAASLLRRSDLTIDQIAVRVGYASRSQFSRAFSDQFDESPSRYRATAIAS